MDLKAAERQKTLTAEKQVSYVRAIIIAFGTLTFFFISNPFIEYKLAHVLLVLIWLYGASVLYFRPYEKYPLLLASWFTSLSDCIFATLWIYATGGFDSPYYIMLYTSIIAVAYRFGLRTTLLTSSLYTACYIALLAILGHLHTHEAIVAVRCGFIFIIGFMSCLITRETLFQTQQKLSMQALVEETQAAQEQLMESQAELAALNEELRLRNDIFGHAEENAFIGSYAWNLQTNSIRYSNNMYRLLGYEPGDFEPTYHRFLLFIHPDDQEKMMQSGESVSNRRVSQEGTFRIITRRGDLKYCHLSSKITGEPGSLMLIGTLQDITNDVRMNEDLESKNIELKRSNDELASFNYIASHDLQEPVRKIHTFSKLILEKEEISDTARSYMGRITSAATRMQHLIEAFLNYSRIDRSGLVFEETDIDKVVKEVSQNLSETIAEKHALIETDHLPVLLAEPFQMHQLFINLVGNSLKYSKPGIAPYIRIFAERINGADIGEPRAIAKNPYWHISVSDNGIGFEPLYAEKIFEVFQRLHGNETYAGTGIGLAICKKIVTTHQGFIRAEGVQDEGATFHIYLPAGQVL